MTLILPASSGTLAPLPRGHRNGLVAVATFGFLSFVATSSLFIYLTYKLIRWYLDKPQLPDEGHYRAPTTDLSLGLPQMQFDQLKPSTNTQPLDTDTRNDAAASGKSLNQFLLLVYNLLFAEMHQSMAFLLNVSWTASDGIFVGSPACWAQGWFISTGDLAASCFITAIAVHTYLTIVREYQPPQRSLYITIACLWLFVYALGIIGVLITNNGRDGGGLYVRAVAWCWINVKYENFRLWLHYFWIFGSLTLTIGLYVAIFLSFQSRNIPSKQDMGSHPGFLLYPMIYGLCTAPLALFRVATMSGRDISVELFCFAGSMIASNGWLDVVLFSWTRSSVIFAPSPNSADTGIDTFAFMRTPHARRFGNMVWVQGPSGGNVIGNTQHGGGGWWKLGGDQGHPKTKNKSHRWPSGLRSMSQESLRGAGGNEIQMDTITSVVVEVDTSNMKPALSIDGSDRVFRTSSTRMHL